MRKIIKKIKFWLWWHFKATEKEKCRWDTITLGISIMKNNKRINPRKIYRY